MSSCVVVDGAIVTESEVLDPGWLAVADGRIAAIGRGAAGPSLVAGAQVVEAAGRFVVPGFVDVHVHGGGGFEVNGSSAAEVAEAVAGLAAFHARHGTTALVATTAADSPERLRASLEGVAAAVRQGMRGGARVLGAHLEGPFLAASRCGAQDPAMLRPPSVDELDELAAAAGGTLRLLTMAPELPGAHEVLARARRLGVRVSVGHTDASYEEASAAFEAGASHVTHLFNAMTPPHHRRPGAVTAALNDDRVTLELIADLEHVHPAMLRLAGRTAPGRVVAVTDAVALAGLEGGSCDLGGRQARLEGSRVVLAEDGTTLAGSALTMEVAVRNLVEAAGFALPEAVRAAATTPAELLGLHDVGVIRVGAVADLALLGDDFSCTATMVGGVLLEA